MCGVFAMSLGEKKSLLPYNVARTLTYGFLYLLLTVLGLAIAPLQKVLGYMSALFAILVALGLLGLLPWQGNSALSRRVNGLMGQLKELPPFPRGLSIGFLNGFVPCHLVYAAIAFAASTAGERPVWQGAVWLMAFGLGTSPMLSAIGLGGQGLAKKVGRVNLQRFSAAFLLVFGVLVFYRTTSSNPGDDHAHHLAVPGQEMHHTEHEAPEVGKPMPEGHPHHEHH
jgi:sulfite exporter TauE/SafE